MSKKHKDLDIILGLDRNDFDIAHVENDISPEGDSCVAKIAEYLSNKEFDESIQEESQESDTVPAPTANAHKKIKKTKKKLITPKSSFKATSNHDISKSPSMQSVSANEDVALLTHRTSHDAIKSIYSLVTSKMPFSNSSSVDFSKNDKRDIQIYFQTKTKEFQDTLIQELGRRPLTPYEISKKEKLQKWNNKLDKKREEILAKKQQEEIERVCKSNEVTKMRLQEKIEAQTQRAVRNIKRNLKIERKKKKSEAKSIHKQEKGLILENIRNFYRDRISLLKEKIESEKIEKKVVEFEQKKILSEAVRERRMRRKQYIEEAKSILEKETEKLQSDLLDSTLCLEEKLLKIYRGYVK
ncbi:unnamed protein product [Blepharisma stoltei]|uniref:Uncharacterized protein n=1 Tax=Blepharisma stoltei TaxID=1481888 RepID=A0AAU9KHE6_9CILI|nr:unnamed protein product [Blepharisma stoltei]